MSEWVVDQNGWKYLVVPDAPDLFEDMGPISELPLDIDLAKNALDQLWGLIHEENMAIIGISIEKDKSNPGGYVVYAKTTENKIYHYAMYITPWGDVIADGI